MDLFDNGKISYSQFISASIPYTKFFNKKRLIVFFNLADINRDQKLSSDDLKNFLNIQFKHRDQDMTAFSSEIVNRFDKNF